MSCAINPQIKNKVTGELQNSNLYRNIMQYTNNNRLLANDIYYRAINEEFINTYNTTLEFDELNQPTFESFYNVSELSKFTGEDNEIKNIKTSLGILTKTGEKSFESQTEVYKKTTEFNNSSLLKDKYFALPKKVVDKTLQKVEYFVDIVKQNFSNSQFKKAYDLNNNLRETITEKFRNVGISVGNITNLEKRLGIKGVIDFDLARQAEKSIIEAVRIAKGELGSDVLLEEHVHLAVDILRNNPLITRAYNTIVKNNLQREILGEEYNAYIEQYGENSEKVVYEAIGKIIFNQIKGYKTNSKIQFLVNRIWDTFKNWAVQTFSKNQTALVKSELSRFTSSIYLTDSQNAFLKPENINMRGKMYAINETTEKVKKTVKTIYNSESSSKLKEFLLKAIEKQHQINKLDKIRHNKEYTAVKNAFLHDLSSAYEFGTPAGIINMIQEYIFYINNTTIELQEKYKEVTKDDSLVINDKAGFSLELKDFTDVSKELLADLHSALTSDKSFDDIKIFNQIYSNSLSEGLVLTEEQKNLRFNEFRVVKENLLEFIDEQQKNIAGLAIENVKLQKNLTVQFLEGILEEEPAFIISMQKAYKEILNIENATVEDMLKSGLFKMNWYQKFVSTATQSNDYLVQIFEKTIKDRTANVRYAVIEEGQAIQAQRKKLEKSGTKTDNFMLELDSEGFKTGYFISKSHWGHFEKAKTEAFTRINESTYKDLVTGEQIPTTERMKKAARSNWFRENTQLDENLLSIPNVKKYPSEQYEKLTDSQKEYYDFIIALKQKLDAHLPLEQRNLFLAPQVMQSFYNNVFESKSIKQSLSNSWKTFTSNFFTTADETGFGKPNIITNLDGSEIKSVPIYFVNKLDDGETLNTDIAGSMMMYSLMANHFDNFNNINNIITMQNDIFDNRTYVEKRAGNHDNEGNKTNVDITNIYQKGEKKYSLIKANKDKVSNAKAVFNQLINTNMYDITKKDESLGGVKVSRLADTFLKLNAIHKMAFNVPSQTTNMLNAKWQIYIEAMGKEFFTLKDVAFGEAEYFKQLPHLTSEIGQRIQTNKLVLTMDFLDMKFEVKNKYGYKDMNKKTLVSQMLSSDLAFALSNSVEFYVHSIVLAATLNNIKVLDASGKEISLYDAFETKNILEDNSSLGKKLQIKEGVTDIDGSAIDTKYLNSISRLVQGLAKDMYGIYTPTEKTILSQYILGRAIHQFRGYLSGNLTRRFGQKTFNFDYNQEMEGYFRTYLSVVWSSRKELMKLNIKLNTDGLSAHQKSNLVKARTEILMYALLAIFNSLLMKLGDDDDELDNENWLYNYTRYTTSRLGSEVGALIPPFMPFEMIRQLDSPIPSMSLFNSFMNITNLPKGFTEVKSGFWKDHYYIEKYLTELIPGAKPFITLTDVPTMKTQRKFFETGLMDNNYFDIFKDEDDN